MSQTVEKTREQRENSAKIVADKFMQRVEQGLPLISPEFPVNGRTGKTYNVVNAMVLTAEGHQDPRWMTMNQANECGMSVRKGEHSTPVSFAKDREWREGPDGKKTEVKLVRPQMVFARVFNGEQIEGMPPMPERPLDWNPQQRADEIIAMTGAKIVETNSNSVFFDPKKDEIQVPRRNPEEEPGQERYYQNCFKGLALWTGGAERLNRQVQGGVGSKDVTREQIRIEMAAAALCASVGIKATTGLNDQKKAQWKALLEEDPKELFAACGQANRIVREIQKFDQKLEMSRDRDAQTIVQPVEKDQEQKVYAKPDLSKATFLKIAYEDRAEAQKLGARFDDDSKRWYAPEGVDANQFKQFAANYNKQEHARKAYLADKHEENRVYIKLLPKDRQKAREKGATFDGFKNEWYIPKGEEKRFQKEMENYQNRVQQIQNIKDRVYLYVPVAEKDEAKQAGAKWDPRAKSWYAGEKADMEKLARWSEIPAERNVVISPEDEFRKVMESKGLVPPEKLEMDGQGHSCKVRGDTDKESGFYIGRLDNRPNGYIKNNQTKETANWVYLGQEPLTEKDVAQLKAEAEKRAKENEIKRIKMHKETARRVNAQLYKLTKVETPTPFMEQNGLQNHCGLFQSSDGKSLMAPIQDMNNVIWSMAYINGNGREGVTQGGKLDTCFHIVDGGGVQALEKAEAICICENVTTAMTVAETTGQKAVAAVMPNNLEKVAVALHEKFPDKTFVICGDDDKKLEFTAQMNTGRLQAEKAAKAIDCAVAFPVFENNPENKLSTFADLARECGRDMVGAQITTVIEDEKTRKLDAKAQTKEKTQKKKQEETKTQKEKKSKARKL